VGIGDESVIKLPTIWPAMSAALARISLLIISTTLQTLSIVPPNPTPDDAHQEKFHKPTSLVSTPSDNYIGKSSPDGWARPKEQKARSRIGSFYFPYAFAASFWVLVILEVPRSFGHEDPLNRRLAFGTFLTTLASLLRLSSFRSLGHHFTYQLAILPSHTLVTTGPYAYIRHPSYVALPLIIFGCALSFTSQGTVLREWFGESSTDGVVLSVLTGMLYVGWRFVKRAEVEDRVLKEEFGKEWEEWARVVKYRFIPGLY
jgi:protein-S-isoprenylcysteine O-methyltransferase Ste14